MKNTIKIITIFGIVTFSFPLYSMEASRKKPEFCLNGDSLKKVNPLLDAKQLPIKSRANSQLIPKSNPLFDEEGFLLQLAAAKFYNKQGESYVKREATLKAIRDAISRGTSVTSAYIIQRGCAVPQILILPCQNPVSLFMMIKNWLPSWGLYLPKDKELEDRQSAYETLMRTIFKAADKRKCYTNGGFKEVIEEIFGINLPQILIDLVFSNLHDQKNMTLIEQAKQEFYEEQQSQPSLDKTSSCSCTIS